MLLMIAAVLLAPVAARAQAESPEAADPEASEDPEEGAAPEGDPQEAASPEEEAPPAEPGELERPNPFKIRTAPGRAVRASEIKARTLQLSRMLDASEDRLRQLAGRVVSGKIGRSGAVIVYRNEMGSSFKLIRAAFALDGAPIFSRVDESGELGNRDEIELFNGAIVPGNHKISVTLEYRGHGYGIFSYLKGYRFKVRSSYSFATEESKVARVRVVGFEKGDQNTPLEERPDIRYVERSEALPASGAIPSSSADEP